MESITLFTQINTEIKIKSSKSSGSGGQKINKTDSRISIFWNLHESQYLTDTEKQRFSNLFASKVTKNGSIVIHRQSHRSSKKNLRACINALVNMIIKSKEPVKSRKKTKPTKSSMEKRLKNKRRQKEKKQNRKITY